MTFVGLLKEKVCFDSRYFLILSILTFSFAIVGMVNVASAVSNSTNNNIAISHIVTAGKGIKVGGMPYAISINPNIDMIYQEAIISCNYKIIVTSLRIS